MEGWVKSLVHKTSGVSRVNFVAAESNTIEVHGVLFFKLNKTTEKTQHASILLLWCHPSVRKPRHSYSFYTYSYTVCFKTKRPPEVAKLAEIATRGVSEGPLMHLVGKHQQTFRLKPKCK